MLKVRNLFLLLFFITGGIKLFAHPHVFINFEANYILEDKKLDGIEVVWNMDEMSSFSIISGYDSNQNKKLDKTEFIDLKTNIFDNMLEENFYIQLTVNDKVVENLSIEDFKITVSKDQVLKFHFFVDSNYRFSDPSNKIKFFFADKSFYISFTSGQDVIEYETDNSLKVTGTDIQYAAEQYLTVE